VSDDSTSEKAKELLVYGPLGLALFLRDSAPQFMRMFVARGRTEVQHRRRTVGQQLDQVKALGETAATDGGPEVLRVLSSGIAALREKVEEALQGLGAVGADGGDSDATSAVAPTTGEAEVAWSTTPTADSSHLAIAGYDDLSASQIVDRLDSLSPAELEAIRAHEAAHRARHTILGKIEQLTHGS
jgi:hypothetical protein